MNRLHRKNKESDYEQILKSLVGWNRKEEPRPQWITRMRKQMANASSWGIYKRGEK